MYMYIFIILLCIIELSPRIVGEAFYNGEMESELRRIDKIEYKFHKDSDREKCMDMIENARRQSIYPHNEDACTDECKKRGATCNCLLHMHNEWW